mmetsp:Transcript_12484/g.18200  ORF Transcript_12484/g.18200 Transcript_12484/m.18200 type:complete len:229 (+) Transcript_12484:115-801(+)|eukprot:CAMPEP_0194076512 /NCGR_PEP_ID=MMETSP0149-20130528/3311_1 /TAXON_ID=122233 /ORGANISM="Chaetoceros debilis, Strain MM31A-1" /LENGTH=228 /DNA_ID=CAMNT_0038757281 /DNA_START=51 /DNA_END=740 /DNA_ORIENTATION=+
MSKSYSTNDVLLFIPNLIGYSRVVASLFSFFLMIFSPDQWQLATAAYLYSFAADLFDGMAARKYDQCSSFGGLLDMVTDRCSTLGLLFILYGEYGSTDHDHFGFYRLLFLILAILDISSHWCQMYSTSSLQIHHKSAEGNAGRFFLVRWYYSSYPFFGYCCVSAEVTYVTFYVLAHAKSGGTLAYIGELITKIVVPGCATKQIVNVFQLCSACHAVAEHDAKSRNKNQ